MLRQNVDTFSKYIATIAADHIAVGLSGYSSLQTVRIQCNRHLLNILTTLRTFVDHSKTYAIQTYGRKSKFVQDLEALIARKRANYPSFDFLYDLRNYVQHCGMPISHIGFSSNEDPSTKVISHVAEFNFDRDSLLKTYNNWKPDVLLTLKQRPPEFPIQPELDSTMLCVAQIALGQMALELPAVKPAVRSLTEIISEVKEQNSRPCIATEWLEADGTPQITIEHLPLETLAHVSRFIADYESGALKNVV